MNFKEEITVNMEKLLEFMQKNEEIFPNVKLDLVMWAYQTVQTRIFGVSPGSAMIPFADMLNHNDQKCLTYYIINKKFEATSSIDKKYELKKEYMDFSLFKDSSM